MMSDKLKPCPWCGSKAELYVVQKTFQAGCTNLKCHAERWPRTKDKAIEYWNRRTPQPTE